MANIETTLWRKVSPGKRRGGKIQKNLIIFKTKIAKLFEQSQRTQVISKREGRLSWLDQKTSGKRKGIMPEVKKFRKE